MLPKMAFGHNFSHFFLLKKYLSSASKLKCTHLVDRRINLVIAKIRNTYQLQQTVYRSVVFVTQTLHTLIATKELRIKTGRCLGRSESSLGKL